MVVGGKTKKKVKRVSSDEESNSESEEEVIRPRKSRRRGAAAESDSDDEDNVDHVLSCLPESAGPLIDFANASQGILLLLMLKQHLKNLCGFSERYSKC